MVFRCILHVRSIAIQFLFLRPSSSRWNNFLAPVLVFLYSFRTFRLFHPLYYSFFSPFYIYIALSSLYPYPSNSRKYFTFSSYPRVSASVSGTGWYSHLLVDLSKVFLFKYFTHEVFCSLFWRSAFGSSFQIYKNFVQTCKHTHTKTLIYIYTWTWMCIWIWCKVYFLCVHTYTHTYIEHRCRMVTIDPFLEVLSSILDSNTKNFEDFMVFLIPLDNCILN